MKQLLINFRLIFPEASRKGPTLTTVVQLKTYQTFNYETKHNCAENMF